MKITDNIYFSDFKLKRGKNKLKDILLSIIKEKCQIILSLSNDYKDSFNIEILRRYKKNSLFRLIGMGGSTLGTQAIYSFLKKKIKKNFFFVDNLSSITNINKKKITNIVISKSGNTIETIVNSNILIKKKDENIFITENKDNYLNLLAKKLRAEIIHHNNYIGGRYSVLSEVGMLPSELMGLNSNKFRQLNNLIKNKNFINSLISNVSAIVTLVKLKKFNSIIINYDQQSNNFFQWYQQLVAESIGKKNSGILPIISCMPKDNHSMMQLYLDGFQNNFFTFFYVKEKVSTKVNNKKFISSKHFLKNKNIDNILYSQKIATENIFIKKKIPFRSFEIVKRDEKTLGELFCFFILETILIGKALEINPFDQPAVEFLKKETKKLLI